MRKLVVFSLLSAWLLASCSAIHPKPKLNGGEYQKPAPPPNIHLPSTTGQVFDLASERGKVVVLFFGYTYCPDVCPETLGLLKSALGQLTPAVRANVIPVFISVDPGRDTLDTVKDYLDRYDAGFIGLAPGPDGVEKLRTDYSIVAEIQKVDGQGDGYLMMHTSLVFVIDKAGDMRLGWLSGTTAEMMAEDLAALVNE